MTTPYWEEFTQIVLARHPEWESFVRGAVAGRAPYGLDDERFFIEVPSVHPTRLEPLVIEVADREPGGPIDTYWGEYFEHNFCWPRGDYHTQIDNVIRRVESWISDDWVFGLSFDLASGRRTGWGGYFASEGEPELQEKADKRYVFWSWLGTHDRGTEG